jgi:hypothetical protein
VFIYIFKQIEIKTKELEQILYDSCKRYPRKYVFESATGGKIKHDTLRNYSKNYNKTPKYKF